MGQSRHRVLTIIFWLAVMLLGGTIAGAIQDVRLARELEEQADEIRLLSDSIQTLLKSACLRPERSGQPDAARIAAEAHRAEVPVPLALAVFAVETGYTTAGYRLRGRAGEYGRGQVHYRYWGTLPECATDRTAQGQVRCSVAILRLCHERWGDWRSAAACYNAFSRPDTTGPYVAAVERELGRMLLRSLQ